MIISSLDPNKMHNAMNLSTKQRRFLPARDCSDLAHKEKHNMGNSFEDESSCKSSTPLTYSTLNVFAPNDQ